MPDSPRSRSAAILAIRPPRGVMEPVPKSSRWPPLRKGTAVRALRALREVRYHHNATLRAHEETCWGLQVGRKPLSDFSVAAVKKGMGLAFVEVIEPKAQKNLEDSS